MTTQDIVFAFTQTEEGGYTDDARDSGNWDKGITGHVRLIGSKFGVGAPALCKWMHPKESTVTAGYMRNLPVATYTAIAMANYWRPLSCDSLPPVVALMAFDFGWNCGVSTSARVLQETLGFTNDDVDGDIGPRTLDALAKVDDLTTFVKQLADAQTAHYRGLSNFSTYGKGWLARTDRRLAAALALLPTTPLS